MRGRSRLSGTAPGHCGVEDVRAMGQGPSGEFHEVRRRNRAVVARFAPAGRLEKVIPCADARGIGGCRAGD
jgi:hypothetical protein